MRSSTCYLLSLILSGALVNATEATTVFVAAEGSPSHSSSFETIAEAQRHVRQLRAAGTSGEIVIEIGEGTHAPFRIGPSDSGLNANARTIYRGQGLTTRVSGGTEIPPALFKPTKTLPAVWDIRIDGQYDSPTLQLNGTKDELFRVRTVAAGGPDDPRHGVCKQYNVDTQNILESTHDNKTWTLAAPLDCGNGWQKIASASFMPGGSLLTADISSLKLDPASFGDIKAGECVHTCATTRAGLSFNDEEMVLARWPNFDFAKGQNVYTHLTSGGAGSFVLTPADDALKARMLQWAGTGWVHGYWEWDWADCYRQVTSVTPSGDHDLQFKFTPADTTPKKNARFYATNLLSELDVPGEYYLENPGNGTMKVHLIPPAGYSSDPSSWAKGPVIGLKSPAVVDMSGSKHTSLQSMQVLHGRGVGVLADDVEGVSIHDVNSSLHTRQGIWLHGTDSSITDCSVSAVGCAGIRAHGGNAESLTPGNLSVSGNRVRNFARFKRTYQAGIHWAGVGNRYTHNIVSDGPHNCFLGGGNEADPNSTVAGVDCVFDSNTLDGCAYEAADTGGFYVCGQMGSAFVNRGNSIRNCTFKNVRNTVGTGVQSASVQAIYLDDQMSGWNISNCTFSNCQVGSFIGGGRRNIVTGNYYEHCDTAQHLDNRGMGWQKGDTQCTDVCAPLSPGCTCDTGGAEWMATKSTAAAQWAARWPYLTKIRTDRLGQPAYNVISGNTYCKCGKFIDASKQSSDSWGTTVENNAEVGGC
eukprot:g2107.t1